MNARLLSLLGGGFGWWILAGAVLSAGVLGFAGAKVFYGVRIEALGRQLAEERLGVERDRGKALLEAHRASETAAADILGRLDRASLVLARETARLPEENQRLRSLLVEVSSDDEFACRRRPLPERLLDRLRRPGGLPNPRDGEGSGAGPGAGMVLPAGGGDTPAELF